MSLYALTAAVYLGHVSGFLLRKNGLAVLVIKILVSTQTCFAEVLRIFFIIIIYSIARTCLEYKNYEST